MSDLIKNDLNTFYQKLSAWIYLRNIESIVSKNEIKNLTGPTGITLETIDLKSVKNLAETQRHE